MAGMNMGPGSMPGMKGSDASMAGMNMGGGSMPGMSHAAKAGAAGQAGKPGKTMPHDTMAGMDMGGGSMPGMAMDQGAMPGMKMDSGSTSGMNRGQNDMSGMDMSNTGMQVDATAKRMQGAVGVDNVAMSPTERLHEAGDGLDGNGRRVLTYADLRAIQPGDDPRPPSREIVLHLSGNMTRYMWSFDGKKFSEAEPIRLKLNERVRFVLINDTMMEHPIHLHGLWSELENAHGAYRPYKHTIIVKPGEKLSYLVTADEPGHWAYHCHLMYHMEMGMFRTVIVA